MDFCPHEKSVIFENPMVIEPGPKDGSLLAFIGQRPTTAATCLRKRRCWKGSGGIEKAGIHPFEVFGEMRRGF